jgi:hypothetical protein
MTPADPFDEVVGFDVMFDQASTKAPIGTGFYSTQSIVKLIRLK